MRTQRLATLALAAALPCVLAGCGADPQPGEVKDEAMLAKREPASFPGAGEDYFAEMDYGVTRDAAEVAARLDPYVPGISPGDAVAAAARGRNNWIVWTAGNDRFWDYISRESFGALDLLKTLSNHPRMSYSRDDRWQYLGLVNEPCFEKPDGPRADRYGLWLDVRRDDCPPDPFENETSYPGVAIGSRGRDIGDGVVHPVGSYYGYATGIVGLRLFPNPEFDAAARRRWDAERYYTERDYYNDKDLVKPYRVGMSCGFCHVGPNPSNPPPDPEHPEWQHLNSNPGAQYFWIDRIFFWDVDETNYVYQMFHTSRPGALDTSLVSSDSINNPRTMNAVYNLGARMAIARRWGRETLAGGGVNNRQLNDYVPAGSPLTAFYRAPETVWTPRVLKDGSDSVGALGALNRVFVNIGLFSEEWVLHFRPLVGIKPISPFEIAVARENSSYWSATEMQTPDLALFFLATARPDKLAEAPGGAEWITPDETRLTHGKEVFADRCARCHSSKLPAPAFDFFPGEGCVGPGYLDCWSDYWAWTKTADFRGAMRDIALAPDFLDDNFLSTDLRVPVTLLETNACSPLATNAIEDDIWDNFSSRSYKDLPSVGTITVHDPFSGEKKPYDMPAGGRGYTRPASLVSLWSTAPYLLNNTVGRFYWSGSVEDRMAAFEDGIAKMLWPERRAGDFEYETASGRMLMGVVDRTTTRGYLKIGYGFLPDFLQKYLGWRRVLPWVEKDEMVLKLGPIPEGTPINLIANLQLLPDKNATPEEARAFEAQRRKVLVKLVVDLLKLPQDASDEQARAVFSNVAGDMLSLNKCPDFVVNRGHYFGTAYLPESEGEPPLADDDKSALIEFLKTF